MGRVVRDDEQRVLPAADHEDCRHEHQRIGPPVERRADGEREDGEIFGYGESRTPRRAARELKDERFWQRKPKVVLELFAFHMPPISTYFTSRYSSMPYLEPSRPRPDCLTPPNGATSVEMMPALTPTMPTSMRSATRQMRPTSRL